MSRSIEPLLERQFEAINEAQERVTVREVLDHDRLIVSSIPETPRRVGLGPRIGLAAAVIAVLAITLTLAWYTSTAPSLDPADSDEIVPQPTTPSTLSAPEPQPTTPSGGEGSVSGGLLDDVDAASLRPLAALTTGDVVVPTAPSGWLITGSGSARPEDVVAPEFVESFVNLTEPRPGFPPFGHYVYLTLSREERCTTGLGCVPTGESVTIDGVTWEAIGVARVPNDPDFVDHGSLRARVGDRWISLEIGAPAEVTRPLLDDPDLLELLGGLRAGSPEDLAAIGVACTDCARAEQSDDGTPVEVPLGAIDPDELRPLDTLSVGDIVIPTAPDDWTLHPWITIDGTDRAFTVGTRRLGGLEIYVGPACDNNASSCLTELFPMGWPPIEQVDIGGHLWGYPPQVPQQHWNVAAVVGDRTVLIVGIWYESRLPLLADPLVVEFVEGLRAGSLDDLPDTVELTNPQGIPLDQTSDQPPPKIPVATVEVGDTTLLLNAEVTGDWVCFTLDRADDDLNVWSSLCLPVAALDGTFMLDMAQLGGGLGMELEYLLVGYVDAPEAVGVRATAGDVTVDGRTGGPSDAFDGVFVLMPADELDDVIGFDGSWSSSEIELTIIEPAG